MSGRVSKSALGRIARQLSERDGRVLHLVHELRIVASRHVEGLIITEGSDLTRARRARSTLARLTDLGLLARLDRTIGGVRAGSSGYLYRLSHAGQRLLGLSGQGWREPGWEFVEHTLLAGDLHVALAQAKARGEIEDLAVEHEPVCWRRYPGVSGAREVLKPDLAVDLMTAEFELCWFIENDRGTESLRRIASKVEQYVAYARTGLEQQRVGVFPRVAWLAPDEKRAEATRGVIDRLGPTAAALCVVTTTKTAVPTLVSINSPQEGGRP